MAAENSDAMTLEQFKVYSGKNAVGGGGWELLWEGNAKSYQSSPATIPVDVRTYEAIYIYGNNVNDPDHRFFLSVKPVSDTMWYAGEDNVFMKIRVAQTMLIEAQYYGITVLQVYGMKSSGGGGQ